MDNIVSIIYRVLYVFLESNWHIRIKFITISYRIPHMSKAAHVEDYFTCEQSTPWVYIFSQIYVKKFYYLMCHWLSFDHRSIKINNIDKPSLAYLLGNNKATLYTATGTRTVYISSGRVKIHTRTTTLMWGKIACSLMFK